MFFKFSVGLIRMRVLSEGGSLSRIYGIYAKGWPGINLGAWHEPLLTLIHTHLAMLVYVERKTQSRRTTHNDQTSEWRRHGSRAVLQ